MADEPHPAGETPSWWRSPDTQPSPQTQPGQAANPVPSVEQPQPPGAAPDPSGPPGPPASPPDGPLTGHDGPGFPAGPPAVVPPRAAGGRARIVVALLAVTGLLVASLAAGYAGSWLHERTEAGPALGVSQPVATDRPAGSVANVAAKVLPSVVSIEVSFAGGQASGSGFVIDAKGYVLTNNHVIAQAADKGQITVVFSDGSQERATVVGRTTPYDLAVLKVGRTGLPALKFGDSGSVVVGDPVVAVGAPLGLESTVTSGIVSAMNRPVSAGSGDDSAFINAIQTDAAINPGNSGGPLVDLDGEVIGVNSAIARAPGSSGGTTGNIGLGFAIPSDQAVRTAQEIIDTGSASYPVIGVLLDRSHRGEGVKVVDQTPPDGQPIVTPGGPAERAGIKPGDLIVAFEGRPVTDPDELIVAIRAQRPGDTVTLTVRRGGHDRKVHLVLEKAESD